MSKYNALALPIFRRYWLWSAGEVVGSKTATSTPSAATTTTAVTVARSWRDGHTLEERFTLVGQRIADRFQKILVAEWKKLEAAREGTLKNRGYRLAQAVLAREDPQETFLKSIPTDHAEMVVHYPQSIGERLVRRRLRLLVSSGKKRHRRRILWWSLAMIPQIPLMVTPLPNITVYYTIYRLYSHLRALQGSKALERGFTALDSQQLRTLRDGLLRYQAATGVVYPESSWPARLIRNEERYLDIFDRLKKLQKRRRLEALLKGEEVPTATAVLEARENQQQEDKIKTSTGEEPFESDEEVEKRRSLVEQDAQPVAESKRSPARMNTDTHVGSTGMQLMFTASAELEEYVQPVSRLNSPLSDDAAMKIGKEFGVVHLLEYVARARRRVVGSMFPAHTEEWSEYTKDQK